MLDNSQRITHVIGKEVKPVKQWLFHCAEPAIGTHLMRTVGKKRTLLRKVHGLVRNVPYLPLLLERTSNAAGSLM